MFPLALQLPVARLILSRIEDEPGMLQSVKVIHNLIENEISSGISSNQVIVAGFSQGCAMSLLAGLTYTRPLGAIVGLSGYLPLRNKFEQLRTDSNRKTPVWLGHGTADPVVNFKVVSLTMRVERIR